MRREGQNLAGDWPSSRLEALVGRQFVCSPGGPSCELIKRANQREQQLRPPQLLLEDSIYFMFELKQSSGGPIKFLGLAKQQRKPAIK